VIAKGALTAMICEDFFTNGDYIATTDITSEGTRKRWIWGLWDGWRLMKEVTAPVRSSLSQLYFQISRNTGNT
jgi:hypothetical protein